jgi:hypothetical protein
MRKRRISGGQDFGIVCACFVVVAFACISAPAEDGVVFADSAIIAPRISSPAADLPVKELPRIKQIKQADLSSQSSISDRPVRRPGGADELPYFSHGRIINRYKKPLVDLQEHRTKIKHENVARDEIKKSADEVRQEARLIALDAQGISFEQRRLMKDAAAEYRRQLRLELIGAVSRHPQIDDGMEDAKRIAKEQARKVAQEARSQTRRE